MVTDFHHVFDVHSDAEILSTLSHISVISFDERNRLNQSQKVLFI